MYLQNSSPFLIVLVLCVGTMVASCTHRTLQSRKEQAVAVVSAVVRKGGRHAKRMLSVIRDKMSLIGYSIRRRMPRDLSDVTKARFRIRVIYTGEVVSVKIIGSPNGIRPATKALAERIREMQFRETSTPEDTTELDMTVLVSTPEEEAP